ncbi:hypothetical protein BD289DRAFT_190478 [Coniella lustricola]|uniref:Uncharacterized protein n=1 Tax=Coniella lustricola TaxID=2025994 RepID=A0A2T3AD15_9PEZI|nr:hypothetical protein BD289DRAFT_190478 [Coniella lustricola]
MADLWMGFAPLSDARPVDQALCLFFFCFLWPLVVSWGLVQTHARRSRPVIAFLLSLLVSRLRKRQAVMVLVACFQFLVSAAQESSVVSRLCQGKQTLGRVGGLAANHWPCPCVSLLFLWFPFWSSSFLFSPAGQAGGGGFCYLPARLWFPARNTGRFGHPIGVVVDSFFWAAHKIQGYKEHLHLHASVDPLGTGVCAGLTDEAPRATRASCTTWQATQPRRRQWT